MSLIRVDADATTRKKWHRNPITHHATEAEIVLGGYGVTQDDLAPTLKRLTSCLAVLHQFAYSAGWRRRFSHHTEI